MEVTATAKYIRVQPRKVRIVAQEVKGKRAVATAHLLGFHASKGAKELRQVLISAIANAGTNNGIAPELLKIRSISVDEGPRLKRMTQKAMGRGARIIKKTSHITVVLETAELEAAVKPHGTKAKARPTLVVKGAAKKKAAKEVVEPKAEEAEVQPVEVVEPVAEAPAEDGQGEA